MSEKWKDIPGYEGIYQASNTGKIRTCAGKTTRNSRYERRVWKQRELKQKYRKRYGGGNEDARVSLWKDGKEKTWLVSRLIAITWCDGYEEGLTVNHIDGNTRNNNAKNLEWVTLSDNIRMGFETGLFPQKSVTLIDESGNEYNFRSMASASRYLGRSNGYVWDMVFKKKKCFVDGYRIVLTA